MNIEWMQVYWRITNRRCTENKSIAVDLSILRTRDPSRRRKDMHNRDTTSLWNQMRATNEIVLWNPRYYRYICEIFCASNKLVVYIRIMEIWFHCGTKMRATSKIVYAMKSTNHRYVVEILCMSNKLIVYIRIWPTTACSTCIPYFR